LGQSSFENPGAFLNLLFNYLDTGATSFSVIKDSFCPAYLMLYKQFSSYLKGDATDIQAMFRNGNITGAKALLEQYRSHESASIAALSAADKEAYAKFCYYLTSNVSRAGREKATQDRQNTNSGETKTCLLLKSSILTLQATASDCATVQV
jgi:hypothetical protein